MGAIDGPVSVLHVDDDPAHLEMAAEFLEREDDRLAVETATSTGEGLDLLGRSEFDCVVSDFNMPGLNGLEFLEAVREDHPELPFILFTGRGNEEVASEAISAGVTDYIQKEGGTDQYAVLANRIENAVFGHRSSREAARRRHRLEQVLRTVPACVVQIRHDGQFVYANRRAEEVLGLDPEAVTGRTYNDPEWDIRDLAGNPIPDEELPFRRVRDTGEPVFGVRHTIEWPDGTRKVLLVNGAPLFDDDGAVESTIFALTDVTDQLDRQRELHRMEQIVRAMNDGAVITREGVVEYVNPRFAELVGVPAEDIAGESMLDFVAEPDRETVADRHQARRSEGRDAPREMYEIALLTDDGDRVPVEIHVSRIAYDGEPATLSLVRDLTERRRHLARFQAFIEHSSDIVTVLGPDGTYRYQSPSGERILGYDADELEGEDAFEYVHPEDRKAVREIFAEAVEDPEMIPTAEYRVRHRDGSWRWIESVGNNQLANPAISGFVVNSRDVTERKRRERELQRQNERLDTFASIVSHDLRNPLNTAMGHLELARESVDADRLDAVERSLRRMEQLVDDLLTVARGGESVSDLEAVSLPDLAEQCWAGVPTADATLSIETDRVVMADPGRLRQLVENVFRNAVEHGGDDVAVRVGDLDDGFFVEDDGPGIPEADRDRVFEWGYSTTDGGTGYGLMIVREVADAHGWAVGIGSSPEGGARFEFTGVGFA